ncbi:UPF0426 protein At1g28150, chloroplastic [Impatiens glandulifera]|uniref:UPF0426 protein At1g28150, chloroplastic n=1 Tax=Impatiens glandulifera TaxID=253017 RepID=UPI001FB091D9|nr:UPF0426 protein At1g28150, chloroplastic [Impatiens glandulifera]
MKTAVDLINLSPSSPLDGDVPERVWKGGAVSWQSRLKRCVALSTTECKSRPFTVKPPSSSSPSSSCFSKPRRGLVTVSFFNLPDKPILNEALKEPVAFMGGIFAGLLRLDLNEEPLREWVAKTTEASGIKENNANNVDGPNQEEQENSPQQIEIE